MRHFTFLVAIICCLGSAVYAQSGNFNGEVVDKISGEPLQGASVELTGSAAKGRHYITGLNGSFSVKNLVPGNYRLSVEFIGFAKYESSVTIPSTGIFKIELIHKQSSLSAVSITGGRGKGSDYASQLADRHADIIQNSVSARAIEVSPDLNVAAVTQRVSGVTLERSTNGEGQYVIIRGMDKRYIYTLINGVKIPSPDNKNRYVPLDVFPADMLQRLEVTKSLTPDMEGDAIGGTVNMIMKDAPSKFTVNTNAGLNYSTGLSGNDFNQFAHTQSLQSSPRIINGPNYLATMQDFPYSMFTHKPTSNPLAFLGALTVGGRVFDNKLGILLGGSYQNNYRYVNSTFFSTETSMSNGDVKVTDIQPRNYSIQQQRSGVNAKLDYKFDEKNQVNLYVAWFDLTRNEVRIASDTNLQLGRTGPGFGRINNSYRDLRDDQQIFNTTLSGDHTLSSRFSLGWIATYSKAKLNRPDEGTLNTGTGVTKDPVTGNPLQLPETLNESYREFTKSSDEDKTGYLNLTYHSKIKTVAADWSAGGMYRDKNRVSDYDDYALRPSNPSNQEYNGDLSNNNFAVFNGQGTPTNALNYTASEKVGGAYAMLKLTFKNFFIVGGARYENTDFSWVTALDKTVYGKTGSIKYYDVLPSVNVKYSLTSKQALRFDYYSAISRPNFYEVIPHNSSDADADYPEQGNPNLKRTVANNLDLKYEIYPHGLDQISAGIFYKHLQNPIEYALINEGTFLYYQAANFGNATNYGLELDATKFWNAFGVRANYTFTNSSITTEKTLYYSIPGGTTSKQVNQTRPLQGQSRNVVNVSLLFKDDNKLGLNAQLAFNYTSRRINTVSQFLNNDIWQKDFEQLDFSVEKKLFTHWYVYAKVNNILNTPFELEILQPYTGADVVGSVKYQTIGQNTFVRKDTYGVNFLLGVKFKF